MKPSIVFFDFGDTLAYLAKSREKTIAASLTALGYPFTAEVVAPALEAARQRYASQSPHNRTLEGRREFYVGRYQVMVEQLGLGAQARALAEYLWDTQPENWALFPDVMPALEALRAADTRLGIISNWDKLNLDEVCRDLGIAALFEVIMPSARAEADKPNPLIFERALELAEAQAEPQSCVHVGDSYEADIEGARAAGLVGILVQRDSDLPFDCPTVRSLEELPRLLRRL